MKHTCAFSLISRGSLMVQGALHALNAHAGAYAGFQSHKFVP